MKIVILGYYSPYEFLNNDERQKYGIISQHPYTWIKNLAISIADFNNCEVHVINFTTLNNFQNYTKNMIFKKYNVFWHFPKNLYYLPNLLLNNRLKVIMSKLPFFPKYIFWRKSVNYLLELAPDIIHAQDSIHSYISYLTNIPSVLTFHTFIDDFSSGQKMDLIFNKNNIQNLGLILFNSLRNRILEMYEKKLKENAKNIIAISQYTEKILIDKKYNSNIVVIGNSVDKIYFEPKDLTEEGYFVYIGSIQHRKNIFEIIKAFERVKDSKLYIVSFNQKSKYYEDTKEYVKNRGLKNRILFTGNKNSKEIVNILKKANGLIIYSKAEGAPMVISEAMALGKAVITSDIAACSEMVIDGKTGFKVELNNITELSKKIKFLLDNPKVAHNMGLRGSKIACLKWHPNIVADETLKVYKKLIDI